MLTPLPNPRRIVTSHTPTGAACVLIDDRVPMQGTSVRGGVAWLTRQTPAEVNGDVDSASFVPPGVVQPGGTVLKYVDFQPEADSPMHFTESIDYGIVLSGEITMKLTDGSVSVVRAGEVIVQRGTNHQWFNKSETWCRMLFICLEAEPISIHGKPLEGLHLP